MPTASFDRLLRIMSAIATPLAVGCGPQVGLGDDTGNDASDSAPNDDGESDADSGDDGIEPIDESQFTENLCADHELDVLGAVRPDAPVDYLVLRAFSRYDYGREVTWSDGWNVDEAGTVCSGASDPVSCATALVELPRDSEFVEIFEDEVHSSLAFTRGDEVGVINTLAGLQAFLGAIDAPADAALLGILQGRKLVCGDGNDAGVHPQGFILHTRTGGGCGEGDDIYHHVVLVRPDGTFEVLQSELIELGDPGCAIGRLPAGLCRRRGMRRRVRPVGAFLAEVAHLEAAAVTAFSQLAGELALHRAPAAMIRGALRSRRDEIRHAQVTAALARRFGGRPMAPRVRGHAPRSLDEVAADNAAEGCIRETYGALVAHVQAKQARDPAMRRVLARIAYDETRHAALSWDLAQWAASRMHPAQRRRVARHTDEALARLSIELTQPYADEVHTITGLPRPDQARALFHQLHAAMFPRANPAARGPRTSGSVSSG